MIFDSVEKSSKGMRSLIYAFAASVVVHLLLLWPRAAVMVETNASAALQATILDQAPPVAPVPAAPPPHRSPATPKLDVSAKEASFGASPVPVVSALPPPAVADPVVSRPEKMVAMQAEPASVPTMTAKAAPASEGSPPAKQPVRSASVATTANSPVSSAAGSAPSSVVSADDLGRYRIALASQARRFKRYPTQARALGWTGTADIRVEVGSDGRARAALLAHSSGHEALDRAALAMVDAGAKRARLPDRLRGRNFSVTLPVVFNFEDE